MYVEESLISIVCKFIFRIKTTNKIAAIALVKSLEDFPRVKDRFVKLTKSLLNKDDL